MKQSKPVILLVEDDENMRMALEGFFPKKKFDVYCFSNKEDTMNFLHSHELPFPNLAILDIKLTTGNDKDGIVIAQRIIRLKKIPIIFLTGHKEEYKDSLNNQGLAYFIIKKTKGDTKEEILEIVNTALGFTHQHRDKIQSYLTDKIRVSIRKKNSQLGEAKREIRIIKIPDILYVKKNDAENSILFLKNKGKIILGIRIERLNSQLERIYGEYRHFFFYLKKRGLIINLNEVVKYDNEKVWFNNRSEYIEVDHLDKYIEQYFLPRIYTKLNRK